MRDPLGYALPAFITRDRAIKWTEYPRPDAVKSVTAREWPARAGRWVVVTWDGTDSDPPNTTIDVRLAVVDVSNREGDKEPSVQRIAWTRAPLTPRPNWNVMPRDFWSPQDCMERCSSNRQTDGMDARVSALDFAPYVLTDTDRAFGVETTAGDSYAGGWASHSALSLLHIEGDALVPILDVPWGASSDLAGEWNEDSTGRSRSWLGASLVLEVRPRKGKVSDLALHSSLGRHSVVYRWNAKARAYGCL